MRDRRIEIAASFLVPDKAGLFKDAELHSDTEVSASGTHTKRIIPWQSPALVRCLDSLNEGWVKKSMMKAKSSTAKASVRAKVTRPLKQVLPPTTEGNQPEAGPSNCPIKYEIDDRPLPNGISKAYVDDEYYSKLSVIEKLCVDNKSDIDLKELAEVIEYYCSGSEIMLTPKQIEYLKR